MSFYELSGYYKIKDELWPEYDDQFKIYPWPCDNDPSRWIKIYPDDVLTIQSEENGICNMIKHTGIGCINIIIPKKDLQEFRNTIQLGI